MLKKPPRTRRRRSQETRRDESRARILAAAEVVFAREGLAGARSEAIAAEAGLNKALIFYYFKDLEKLYETVIEEHLREFSRQSLAVLNAPGPAGKLLLRYLNLHFDFICHKHRHATLFQQVMTKGCGPPENLFRKYIVPRADALQNLLARGMRQGEFRRLDPFHTAFSIAALVVFYFSSAPILKLFGYPDPFAAANLKRRKQEVLSFIRHALFIHPNAK